jgi:hypothetical protein
MVETFLSVQYMTLQNLSIYASFYIQIIVAEGINNWF